MTRSWLAVLPLSVAACTAPPSRPWDPKIADISSPARPKTSSEPQLTAFDGRAVLSWIERAGEETAALKFSERTSGGWTPPVLVASGDDWFVNWADVPSVARIGDSLLAAHWLQNNGPDPEGYDVKLAFSRDGGKTWTKPATPHHDGTLNEHGFASLYPAAGGLGLVWLDGRGEDATALRSAIFAADGSQTTETQVDDRVCECCPTSVAVTADSAIVAYRDRSERNARNISVVRFSNGAWTKPVTVHDDDWKIDACPVNGPAVAARGKTVAVAWFNAKADEGHAFVAFSSDGGATFGQPARVDDASALGRVSLAMLDDGSVAVSWLEFADSRAHLRLRRATVDGLPSPSITVAGTSGGKVTGNPRLVRVGNELLFAWTESDAGTTRVRTASVAIDGSGGGSR